MPSSSGGEAPGGHRSGVPGGGGVHRGPGLGDGDVGGGGYTGRGWGLGALGALGDLGDLNMEGFLWVFCNNLTVRQCDRALGIIVVNYCNLPYLPSLLEEPTCEFFKCQTFFLEGGSGKLEKHCGGSTSVVPVSRIFDGEHDGPRDFWGILFRETHIFCSAHLHTHQVDCMNIYIYI